MKETKEQLKIVLLEEDDCLYQVNIPKNKIFIQTTYLPRLEKKSEFKNKKRRVINPVKPIYIKFDHKYLPPYGPPNMEEVTEDLRKCLIEYKE